MKPDCLPQLQNPEDLVLGMRGYGKLDADRTTITEVQVVSYSIILNSQVTQEGKE
jgi:hypothetical protein